MPKKNNPGCRCCTTTATEIAISFAAVLVRAFKVAFWLNKACSTCIGSTIPEFFQVTVPVGFTGQSPTNPDDCTDAECDGLAGEYYMGPFDGGANDCSIFNVQDTGPLPVTCGDNIVYDRASLEMEHQLNGGQFSRQFQIQKGVTNHRITYGDAGGGGNIDCDAQEVVLPFRFTSFDPGGWCEGTSVTMSPASGNV